MERTKAGLAEHAPCNCSSLSHPFFRLALLCRRPSRFDSLVLAASLGAFACYFLSAILHGELMALMFVMPQYLFMLPTYANIFSVFSFCNMHDISWGTKEGTSRWSSVTGARLCCSLVVC